MKHNILHIVQSFDISGRSKVIYELDSSLNKSDNFSSRVVSMEKVCQFYAEQDLDNIESIDKKEGFAVSAIFRTIRVIKKNKINIVHTHGKGSVLYGVIAKKVCNIPLLVHTVHRADGDVITNNKYAKLLVSKTIDKAVAVSSSAAKAFIEKNKFPEEKVAVIYSGINISTQDMSQSNKSLCQELIDFKKKNSFLLGMVANFSYDKDFDTLIKAFSAVSKIDATIGLVLIGGGPRFCEIKERVESDKFIAEKVLMLGFRNDVKMLLSYIDVFVLSTLTEGLGVVILEAMASKIPVIATNVGGIPDIIKHGNSGLLFSSKNSSELRDSILLLKNNKVLRENIVENAFKMVKEKFSLDQFIESYKKIYTGLKP